MQGLQGDAFAAKGLGVLNDTPIISLQPKLTDGVHLRWWSASETGWPKGGYQVYRRISGAGETICLSAFLDGFGTQWPDSTLNFESGTLTCDVGLNFQEGFAPSSVPEIRIPRSAPLECAFVRPVHSVQVQIGFGQARSSANPLERLIEIIKCVLARLRLWRDARAVDRRLSDSDTEASRTRTEGGDRPRSDRPEQEGPGEDRLCQVAVRVWDDGDLLQEAIISSPENSIQSADFAFDRVTRVTFQSLDFEREQTHCEPVLVDICWQDVSLEGPWEPLADFPYPLKPPVAANASPQTFAGAEAMATARVKYGSPAAYSGSAFKDLFGVITDLTALPSDQMATFKALYPASGPDGPDTLEVELMGLVEIAALNPALAQMIGLYWIDETAQLGQRYDYMVLADYDEALTDNPTQSISVLQNGLPDGVVAWIVHDQAKQAAPPLAGMAAPYAAALPETFYSKAAPGHRGAVGLGWDISVKASGALDSHSPVAALVWRVDHGFNEPMQAPSQAQFKVLNAHATIPVASESPPTTAAVTDIWPSFPIRFVDRPLAEGWYSYAVSGIDIWGRYSALSAPAGWRQWAPAPAPRPWWFRPPDIDQKIHHYGVAILNKHPPASPMGVEAQALDPDDFDGFSRTPAYQSWESSNGGPWWNSLSDAERAAVLPLRVAWRWTKAQQDAHPTTRQFRIYFNPGSATPKPDPAVPTNWAERVFIIDEAKYHVIDNATGDRLYELFLPIDAAATGFSGAPLSPSLAQPVVYANVTITAADAATHTSDWLLGGAWGDQYGNESAAAPGAKVFRVYRQPPPPPGPVLKDERVWASRADYYGRSYWTMRWTAQPYLKGLVYSAMDQSVLIEERVNGLYAAAADDIAAWSEIWTDPSGVIAEINAFRALKAADDGTPKWWDAWSAAIAALSDNAWRSLAASPANESAFRQETVEGVDAPDALGPADPPDYTPDPALQAYRVGFDGRTQNRYFLKTAYVNSAQIEGPLSLPTPPIYMPRRVAPARPVIVKAEGGDLSATLHWATAGLLKGSLIQVYRTDNPHRAEDTSQMTLVGAVPVSATDLAKPSISWTDAFIIGGVTWRYRLVQLDPDGAKSEPSTLASIYVADETPPDPPVWIEAEWKTEDKTTGELFHWPGLGKIPAGHIPVVELVWVTGVTSPGFKMLRRTDQSGPWITPFEGSVALAQEAGADIFRYVDRNANPTKSHEYKLSVRTNSGVWSRREAIKELEEAAP